MNELIILIGIGALIYIMVGYCIARYGFKLEGGERAGMTIFWLPLGIAYMFLAVLS